MALPAGVVTATVTIGVPVTFTGTNLSTTVTVTPSADLIHTATGTPLVAMLEDLSVAEGVMGQLTLPVTDQDGFQDLAGNAYKNWYYTVTLQYSKQGKTLPAKTKVFQVPTGQSLIDLDLIPSGNAAIPMVAPTLTVTSVDGKTGAVSLAGTYIQLVQAAKNPDLLIVGSINRDANNVITTAAVVWPDGTPGTFTTDTVDPSGAINSYHITYGSPVTKTYTQPTITRNSSGAATNVPQIVVS